MNQAIIFKTSTWGGFDKQEVLAYIRKMNEYTDNLKLEMQEQLRFEIESKNAAKDEILKLTQMLNDKDCVLENLKKAYADQEKHIKTYPKQFGEYDATKQQIQQENTADIIEKTFAKVHHIQQESVYKMIDIADKINCFYENLDGIKSEIASTLQITEQQLQNIKDAIVNTQSDMNQIQLLPIDQYPAPKIDLHVFETTLETKIQEYAMEEITIKPFEENSTNVLEEIEETIDTINEENSPIDFMQEIDLHAFETIQEYIMEEITIKPFEENSTNVLEEIGETIDTIDEETKPIDFMQKINLDSFETKIEEYQMQDMIKEKDPFDLCTKIEEAIIQRDEIQSEPTKECVFEKAQEKILEEAQKYKNINILSSNDVLDIFLKAKNENSKEL